MGSGAFCEQGRPTRRPRRGGTRSALGSDLLEESEKTFVEAALSAVYEDAEEQLDELGARGEAVEVYLDADNILQIGPRSDVSSTQEPFDPGDSHG